MDPITEELRREAQQATRDHLAMLQQLTSPHERRAEQPKRKKRMKLKRLMPTEHPSPEAMRREAWNDHGR